jgi:hypothetical protein
MPVLLFLWAKAHEQQQQQHCEQWLSVPGSLPLETGTWCGHADAWKPGATGARAPTPSPPCKSTRARARLSHSMP